MYIFILIRDSQFILIDQPKITDNKFNDFLCFVTVWELYILSY